jgi:hypothetical protein
MGQIRKLGHDTQGQIQAVNIVIAMLFYADAGSIRLSNTGPSKRKARRD